MEIMGMDVIGYAVLGTTDEGDMVHQRFGTEDEAERYAGVLADAMVIPIVDVEVVES